MYPEKQTILASEQIEEGQENRPTMTLDFRRISLATLLSALASVVMVGVCSVFEQSQLRKLVLGGALSLLIRADNAASLVAVASAISHIQIGSRRFVEVLPRKSSGLIRVLMIAAVVAFLRGSMEFYVPEKIYGWEQTDGGLIAEMTTDVATDLAKVATEA